MERGSARFRTKEHFLPFQLSPLELQFYTFSFLSLLGFLIAHPSTSRARERNGIGRVSFSDIWFSPCKPPPPSRIVYTGQSLIHGHRPRNPKRSKQLFHAGSSRGCWIILFRMPRPRVTGMATPSPPSFFVHPTPVAYNHGEIQPPHWPGFPVILCLLPPI